MPAFQRYSPDATYAAARSASGFSTNSTACRAVAAPGSGAPVRMYPKPVAGPVGSTPIVTRCPSRATSTASRITAWNASVSGMTWSAANEPMTASGSWRSTTAAASPMAAIESRGDGSASTRSAGRSGSWARTASAWATPVTTTTRSPVSGSSRSSVAWRSERPLPVRSRRNLGRAARLSGQSRVPAPPAGTTAQKPGMPVTAQLPRGKLSTTRQTPSTSWWYSSTEATMNPQRKSASPSKARSSEPSSRWCATVTCGW